MNKKSFIWISLSSRLWLLLPHTCTKNLHACKSTLAIGRIVYNLPLALPSIHVVVSYKLGFLKILLP